MIEYHLKLDILYDKERRKVTHKTLMERIQADVKFLIYLKSGSFIQNKQYDTLTLKLTIRQIFVFVHPVIYFHCEIRSYV